nr:histidinol dehydrogenase [Lentibacillus cibarius]
MLKKVTAKQFRQTYTTASVQTQDSRLDETVLTIISDVRNNGDRALFRLTEELDGVSLSNLQVTGDEFREAEMAISRQFKTALETARKNIEAFHVEQKEQSWFMNPDSGITLGQKVTPIERVGIYIPGGKAAYPSSVLMNVIPAKLAGVSEIAITTPPDENGNISPYVLLRPWKQVLIMSIKSGAHRPLPHLLMVQKR